MNPSLLSGTRNYLIQQLLFFDEHRSAFFDAYFPEPGKERSRVDKQIQSYVETLERLLVLDDSTLQQALRSVVLLGSRVAISFGDGADEAFTVVYPTETDPDCNRVSFLSPIGSQLLLTSSGDELLLETPAGSDAVRIGEVSLVHLGGFTAVS